MLFPGELNQENTGNKKGFGIDKPKYKVTKEQLHYIQNNFKIEFIWK